MTEPPLHLRQPSVRQQLLVQTDCLVTLMLHLVTKLTLIIRQASNSAVVTADAAYTISSKTHSRHGNVYGLIASSTAKTITNTEITQKPISLSGSRNYNGTTIVVLQI